MVFAAGLGTRLRPITDSMPKALVPICGKPLLYHTLRKLVDAGCDEIVVNVHHFPDQIRKYLADNDFSATIHISDESSALLETGGGILHARQFLDGSFDAVRGRGEPFLVHNVDIVSNLDLAWFRDQWKPDALATLLVSERRTQRYLLFDDDMRLVGWTNLATGEVRSPFPALDPGKCRRYAFAGIHDISPRIFSAFDALGFSGRFPIMDFYLRACAEYPIYGLAAPGLTLVDVGKIETLAEAETVCRSIVRRS